LSPDDERRRRGFLEFRPVNLDLGDVLVQIIAVALGVVLGFGVTSWTERVRQRGLFRDTVGTIVNEIKSNQTGMRLVIKEHAALAAALAVPLKDPRRSVSIDQVQRALMSRAFRLNVPLSIAWQIAQNDQGLTLLPFQDRYDLAWVYQLQTIYYGAEQRYQESILSFHDAPGGNYYAEAANLANQMTAVVLSERQLDDAYSRALKRSQQNIGH